MSFPKESEFRLVLITALLLICCGLALGQQPPDSATANPSSQPSASQPPNPEQTPGSANQAPNTTDQAPPPSDTPAISPDQPPGAAQQTPLPDQTGSATQRAGKMRKRAAKPSATPAESKPTSAADMPAPPPPAPTNNTHSDFQTIRLIRRAVYLDKSLSVYAHNVTIHSKDGHVTLKGGVQSEQEKKSVEMHAKSIAGDTNVENQIWIRGKRGK